MTRSRTTIVAIVVVVLLLVLTAISGGADALLALWRGSLGSWYAITSYRRRFQAFSLVRFSDFLGRSGRPRHC